MNAMNRNVVNVQTEQWVLLPPLVLCGVDIFDIYVT